jgi:hypothetical protein
MIREIKHLYNRIVRVIEFIPVIWNTYDFDSQSVLDMMYFQLSRIEKFFSSDKAYSVDSQYNAKRINTFLKLLKKVKEEEYLDEVWEKCEKKYGKEATEFILEPSVERPEEKVLKIGYENLPEKEKIKKDLDFWNEEAQRKQTKAYNLMWKILKKDLENWWD